MASDDRTSQDAAVIGDDLVEALGFEPITSENTEVAVLDEDLDEAVEMLDDGDVTTDDIEIVDDSADDDLADLLGSIDTGEAASDLDESDSDEVGESEQAEPTAAVTNPADEGAAPAVAENLEGTEDVEESTSLFGSPAPWTKPATPDAEDVAVIEDTVSDDGVAEETEAEETVADATSAGDSVSADSVSGDSATAETATAESAVEATDVAADPEADDADSVVFFSNGIDTDTAPLADVDKPDIDLTDSADPAVETDDDISSAADADGSESDDAAADDAVAGDTAVDEVEADGELDQPAINEPDTIDLDGPPPPVVVDLDEKLEADSLLESAPVVPLEVPLGDDTEFSDLDPATRDEPAVPETSENTDLVAPESAVVAAPSKVKTRKKLRARKSRRVIRHIDPWSVLTFSVLFHLCFFAALLLGSVLVWNAALAAGTIENIENFIRELGDYETFEINSDQVFRAAALIAGLLTLASSVLVVLLTVVFNLISDLIGGIRVTVIEEETVRIPTTAKK